MDNIHTPDGTMAMPIINRLDELVKERELRELKPGEHYTLEKLVELTGLSIHTVRAWRKGYVERADLGALSKWCKWLGVSVGDILVYVPEEEAD